MFDLIAPYDWEYLESDLIINGEAIAPCKSLTPHPEQISIKRDKDYYISAQVEGHGAPIWSEYDNRSTKLGETISGEDVLAQINPSEKIKLHNLIHQGLTVTGDGIFTGKVNIFKVTRIRTSDKPKHSTVVYALNCPDLSWNKGTSRSFKGNLTVKSGVNSRSDSGLSSFIYNETSEGHTVNCTILSNKYGKVILTKSDIPKLQHLKPCTLHFIDGTGKFDEDHQRIWIEAISYFFGERLIKVGSSILSSEGHMIEQTSLNPYAHNLRKELNNHGLLPFDVNSSNGKIDENRISKAIESFIENYEQLKLGDVVWKIWYGRMMPLGMNLTSYSSSLEALMNAWFASSKSKSHGSYIEVSQFQSEINPIMTSLKTKYSNDPAWIKIISRLEGANQISISDKYQRFFQELSIESGNVEKEVISSRNKFAHGGAVKSNQSNYVVKAARAYETLINRCILKALGVSNHYIDYSEYDFPNRPIKDKLRGAKGTCELLPE